MEVYDTQEQLVSVLNKQVNVAPFMNTEILRDVKTKKKSSHAGHVKVKLSPYICLESQGFSI